MIGPVSPTEARSPRGGPEDDDGEKKKHAGHFEPENSADARKRANEAADAFAEIACGLAGDLAGGAASLGGKWIASRGLGSRGEALAGEASGNAEADAEGAADGLRLHFELMVTACGWRGD